MAASSARRLGASDSKSRTKLLDAAEKLLLAEGYAAVTSRRVAAEAGLKPQLVHYYFRTMDDLYVEVFRRRAEENLERVERGLRENASLADLWRFNADPRGASFTIEFTALANHRKTIRAELKRYAERFRRAQLTALSRALEAGGVPEDRLPPMVALLLMTGLTQVLSLEKSLGVTAGHSATTRFVEDAIRKLDRVGAAPAPSRTATPTRRRTAAGPRARPRG